LDRAKGVVRHLSMLRFAQGIEGAAFTDIRQSNNPNAQTHFCYLPIQKSGSPWLLYLKKSNCRSIIKSNQPAET
jgi:hypothetical protein